jgi:hypothetical protein
MRRGPAYQAPEADDRVHFAHFRHTPRGLWNLEGAGDLVHDDVVARRAGGDERLDRRVAKPRRDEIVESRDDDRETQAVGMEIGGWLRLALSH